MAAFLIFAMLCVGIFAGIRWNNGSQSNDPPPPTTQRAAVKNKDRGSTSKAETRQAEKERYSDKLPAEGMPVRCLQYTTLGAPDKNPASSAGFACPASHAVLPESSSASVGPA